ncbi:4-alpha-glucanotransferase [Thermodesulfovibrio hydrogeniphilus]
MNNSSQITKFAEELGILPFYYNYKGEKIEISFETKYSIVSKIFSLETPLTIHQPQIIEPVYVIENQPLNIKIAKTLNLAKVEILPNEDIGMTGEPIIFEIKNADSIQLPILPFGYYKLHLFTNHQSPATNHQSPATSHLIIAPSECYDVFKRKTWGLHINLWSLRGNREEGNFSHLKKIAEFAKQKGGFISINPLHFNDPEDVFGISPYSAISREFKTPLYLSDASVVEKNEKFFEYKKIWQEKIKKLKEKFQQILKNQAQKIDDLEEYKKSLCPAIRKDLEYFAVFCYLREKFGKNWQSWKEELRNFNESVIDKIYEENQREILFYEYLQMLIDKELEEIKKYNLCLDLAFGSVKQSFDVWRHQEIYALQCELGAPPDDFNPKGQKWGFPPLIPFKLRQEGYIPFIKILKANMKGSILRFDHALGLFRAFWIPEGFSAKDGAYVKYPYQELLSIIALESWINKTAVIGEDLGTAEDWMRQELIKRKMSSWRVFYFEKRDEGFKKSDEYPEEALCSITTHDLPTLKGYWMGKDLEIRKKLSLFDDSTYEKALQDREGDKKKILELLNISQESLHKILLSIIKFLSNTKCKYLLLYPEDLLLIEEQTNLPGTTTEYPNWQRKLPLTVEEFLKLPIWAEIELILRDSGRTAHSE